MSDDLFALGAAACWALGSLLSAAPARHLGAFAFTRWRMLMVTVMLLVAGCLQGGAGSLTLAGFGLMALSGLIGIFVGDTANFSAMNRLGPRRANVLFATNALFSALLGALVFDERMTPQAVLGGGLTLSGVMIAIVFGRHKSDEHVWEASRGRPAIGIALGLLAALCQAIGALIAKPAMVAGMDPVAAATVRVAVACTAHFGLFWLGVGAARPTLPPTRRVLARTAASGLVGMALGMTLLLLALQSGDVGMVAILSSVSPILILPLLWFFQGRAPARGAWIGAALTVFGTILILSR